MHTIKKSFALALSFAALTSCATSSQRNPASATVGDTTLSGVRSNPVKYTLAPKWNVRLHDGETNKWDDSEKLNLVVYSLGTEEGFSSFKSRIENLINQNEAVAKTHKKGKGIFPKGAVIALNEIASLLNLISSRKLSERDHADALQHIAELTSTFSLSFEYPIPPKVFVLQAPLKMAAEFSNKPMDKDAGPAVNISSNGINDLSLVDPANSTFWQAPGDIRGKDMYLGFNRTELPTFNTPCQYDEPKTSYGAQAGIVVKCNGKKWKLKFGVETKTEPFNSRLVWALGYNAIPVDYVKIAWLDYDRKMIQEFNSRKNLSTRITSGLGFDITKLKLQLYLNPFEVGLAGAILKNGSQIDSRTLKARLLKNQAVQAEVKDENYNTEFESQIKYLVLAESSAEASTLDHEKNIGPWSWNDLDHPNRRETRGFSILAAFLNLYDVRTDNNKVRFVKAGDGTLHMKHFVSDLGSGLGAGANLMNHFDGDTNLYPWTVVKAHKEPRDSSPMDHASVRKHKQVRLVERYSFKGYSVIMNNESFNRARAEDARWLVRKLSQVSEAQLQDALIAAGWSAAEIRLYLEKFASRRDNLVKAFELEKEIALSRPQGVDQKFNFDPRTERAFSVSSLPAIVAPINNKKIVGGVIVSH